MICALLSPAPVWAGPQSSATCTITGTASDDKLIGTSGNDVICGLGGNDTIYGGLGNDTIYGGTGSDRIYGGSGSDKILAGSGDDKVFGNNQNDFLFGDAGKDYLSGGSGSDMMSGGTGKDAIVAKFGEDMCAAISRSEVQGACAVDRQAPQINTGTYDIRTVEAGSAATFTWQVADTAGVDSSWMTVGGPSGPIIDWCGFWAQANRVEGIAQNGTYSVTCNIPQSAPAQNYRLFINAKDVLGHTTQSDSVFDIKLVGGVVDTESPTFTAVSVPKTVKPGTEFELTWNTTDETGVVYSSAYFTTDNRFTDGYLNPVANAERISGTDKDATYRQTFTLLDSAPTGVYTIWSVGMDKAGNKQCYITSATFTVAR